MRHVTRGGTWLSYLSSRYTYSAERSRPVNKTRPEYEYQQENSAHSVPSWLTGTLVSYRWHTHDRSAPENTGDTLNKRRLLSTITACMSLWLESTCCYDSQSGQETQRWQHTLGLGCRCVGWANLGDTHTHQKLTYSTPNIAFIFIVMAQNPESFHVFTSESLQLHFSTTLILWSRLCFLHNKTRGSLIATAI